MEPTHAVQCSSGDATVEVFRGDADAANLIAGRLADLTDLLGEMTGVSVVPVGDAQQYPTHVPFMHVWPQQMWHDSARVVVDAPGALALLSAAVQVALTGAAQVQVFAADGEGYDLEVTCSDVDDDEDVAGQDLWDTPYVDPIAGGPSQLPGSPTVRRILDTFDALDPDARAAVPDELAAAVAALRTECFGALLAPDDPRAA